MENYQKILVILDPAKEEQQALRRAAYLVKKNGGKIKAFLAIHEFGYEDTALLSLNDKTAMRQEAIDKRIDWVKELSKHYLENGIHIDIKVIWDSKIFQAIIDEINQGEHDLVIKETRQIDKFASLIFTPLDWQLLRKCPCPIWMVKEQPWPEGGKALVAVNLSTDDPEYEALNNKLVSETLNLAKLLDNREVNLIVAYPEAALNIALEFHEYNPTDYKQAIRGQYLLAMKTLRQKFSIKEEDTIVEQGLPEIIIPRAAEQINAGVVIIGSIGRTGLSAAFLGNTSERVIKNLACDLLAIKPDPYDDDDE